MTEQTPYQKLAAMIVAGVSGEQLQQLAEESLKNAINTYDTKEAMSKLIRPEVVRVTQEVMVTPEFQRKLFKEVELMLTGLMEVSAKRVCADLVVALRK